MLAGKNMNDLMYMGDIKLFDKNESALENVIQRVRIYANYIGMEYGIEKCIMLVMKMAEWHMKEGIELSNKENN